MMLKLVQDSTSLCQLVMVERGAITRKGPWMPVFYSVWGRGVLTCLERSTCGAKIHCNEQARVFGKGSSYMKATIGLYYQTPTMYTVGQSNFHLIHLYIHYTLLICIQPPLLILSLLGTLKWSLQQATCSTIN